ncbi:hypothetical protein [robinz microvirus RP_133]|nr:hypothetical protein [robinz microvirus RP_133]
MRDKQGREIPDPIPVAIPIKWSRPPTLQEQIRMFIRRDLSDQASLKGHETFAEADDFDVDDDFDPTSPWELSYDQETVGSDGSGNNGSRRSSDKRRRSSDRDDSGQLDGSRKGDAQKQGDSDGRAGKAKPHKQPKSGNTEPPAEKIA